jgi:hypothetical protein
MKNMFMTYSWEPTGHPQDEFSRFAADSAIYPGIQSFCQGYPIKCPIANREKPFIFKAAGKHYLVQDPLDEKENRVVEVSLDYPLMANDPNWSLTQNQSWSFVRGLTDLKGGHSVNLADFIIPLAPGWTRQRIHRVTDIAPRGEYPLMPLISMAYRLYQLWVNYESEVNSCIEHEACLIAIKLALSNEYLNMIGARIIEAARCTSANIARWTIAMTEAEHLEFIIRGSAHTPEFTCKEIRGRQYAWIISPPEFYPPAELMYQAQIMVKDFLPIANQVNFNKEDEDYKEIWNLKIWKPTKELISYATLPEELHPTTDFQVTAKRKFSIEPPQNQNRVVTPTEDDSNSGTSFARRVLASALAQARQDQLEDPSEDDHDFDHWGDDSDGSGRAVDLMIHDESEEVDVSVDHYERFIAKLHSSGQNNDYDLALDTMCCCSGVIMNEHLGYKLVKADKPTKLNGLTGSTTSTLDIVMPHFGKLKYLPPEPGRPIYNVLGFNHALRKGHYIKYYYHLKAFILFPRNCADFIYVFRENHGGYICKGGRMVKAPCSIKELNRTESEYVKNAWLMSV